jgi:hypothetical protein
MVIFLVFGFSDDGFSEFCHEVSKSQRFFKFFLFLKSVFLIYFHFIGIWILNYWNFCLNLIFELELVTVFLEHRLKKFYKSLKTYLNFSTQ